MRIEAAAFRGRPVSFLWIGPWTQPLRDVPDQRNVGLRTGDILWTVILTTLLFIDIVGSTGHADRLGDARWRRLLEDYRAVSRAEIAQHDGIEVETIGDGVFARFDSPARALECAKALRVGVRRLGIEIRAGLHTGECELQSGKLAGMAVHIAARVQAAAAPGATAYMRALAISGSKRNPSRTVHLSRRRAVARVTCPYSSARRRPPAAPSRCSGSDP